MTFTNLTDHTKRLVENLWTASSQYLPHNPLSVHGRKDADKSFEIISLHWTWMVEDMKATGMT